MSVIIVNYNGGDFIQTALDCLKRQTRAADEVIVVDNASEDGSADRMDLSGLNEARLIRLDDNVGFAAGNNLAACEANGEWLLLLNPDTEAKPDWIEELLRAAARHPGVNMFASAQLDATDPSVMDGAGDAYSILGIPWRGGFGRPASEMPAEGECFSPCGAAMLVRRSTFLEAGGFDESFFCYCEDVDLGFRLRLKGERCVFVPGAIVHHHGSAITGRHSDFTVRLGTRNRIRAYLQNMPPVALAITLPGHFLATLYLYVRALGKPHAPAMRAGISEALGDLGATWTRRQRVQAARTLSSWDILTKMSWNPLRLSARKTHVWPVSGTGAAKK
ncbi:MAG: glycosyltransferase family 2 protein [Henriciella sp.]